MENFRFYVYSEKIELCVYFWILQYHFEQTCDMNELGKEILN